MADGATLGKAYIQIVPSMEGTSSKVLDLLNGKSGKAGKEAGESFSSSFSSIVKTAIGALSIGATIKKSFNLGADLEQQIGGVETLFKNSSQKMRKYANEAYKTTGLSANAYMQNVTSFSASLLGSLKGDTDKATDYANRAMIDMSDNANKFGTDISSIQNAYQGFSKQNYTMLDNLKLGYGGTKEEMARLIKNASKMKDEMAELGVTVKANDMSFGNIVNAISVVQKNLDIAGTTSKEASTTFSGSFSAMQASAKNFLAALMLNGKDGVDVNETLQPLIDSISTFVFYNLIPATGRFVGAVFEAIPKLIENGLDSISQNISEALGGIIDADTIKLAIETIVVAFTAFYTAEAIMGLPARIESIGKALTALTANPTALIIAAIAAIVFAIIQLWNNNEEFREFVINLWKEITSFLSKSWNDLVTTATTTWNNLKNSVTSVVTSIKTTISNIWNNIVSTTTTVWNKVVSLIENPMNRAKNTVSNIINTIKGLFNFRISWPHIPMPHFGISPSGWSIGDLLKGSIPHLSVNWYAKAMNQPYVLEKATLFGAGEKGAEVVYGHRQLMNDIRNATAESKKSGDYEVNFYIYANDGQSAKEIADEVDEMLEKKKKRDEVVFE